VSKTTREIGERIAQARRELGVRERKDIRPVDVARALEVSGASVSDWEAGKAAPGDENLRRLAAFLGVTPQFLRYGVRDTLTIAGLEIDVATIERPSDAELAEWKRLVERLEAQKAAPPPTRQAGNSGRGRR
jgi:transcriptional regulator with XRE-family HTH domain